MNKKIKKKKFMRGKNWKRHKKRMRIKIKEELNQIVLYINKNKQRKDAVNIFTYLLILSKFIAILI